MYLIDVPVLVLASEKGRFLLPGWMYLFNNFWSIDQEVVVLGCEKPVWFITSDNVKFSDIGVNVPVQQWSTGYLDYLEQATFDHFIFMHEDYYLTRLVDIDAVAELLDYARQHPEVARVDLTSDRLHAKGDSRSATDIGSWGHLDLIETDHELQYQMSHQCCIFNRKHILTLVERNRTAWEVEMYTDFRKHPELRVVGTRQHPVRYANIQKEGVTQKDELDKIPSPHREIAAELIRYARPL